MLSSLESTISFSESYRTRLRTTETTVVIQKFSDPSTVISSRHILVKMLKYCTYCYSYSGSQMYSTLNIVELKHWFAMENLLCHDPQSSQLKTRVYTSPLSFNTSVSFAFISNARRFQLQIIFGFRGV